MEESTRLVEHAAVGPMRHKLACSHCGSSFAAARSDRKYCSDRCSRRAYSERRIRDGRLAEQRQRHAAKREAWMRANRDRLSAMARDRRETLACEVCGAEVEVRKGEPTRTCGDPICVYYIKYDAWPSSRIPGEGPSRGDIRAGLEDGNWGLLVWGLWSYSEVASNGCWEWQGRTSTGRYPYPIVRWHQNGKRTQYQAHRLALMARLGADLGSQAAHHLCANSLCVNPDHLQAVTHRENVAEMLARHSYLARIRELEAALEAVSPGHELLSRVPVL